MVPIEALKPHPRNPNRHGEEQIRLLAKIIGHQGWRSPVVVSRRSGCVVAGHGRIDAARALGVETVPVNYQEFATDEDELAFIRSDSNTAQSIATSTQAGSGMVLVNGEKRLFTIDELKKMFGFPCDFKTHGSFAKQWARFGNSVPPVMMYHIAAVIRDSVLA